MHVYSGWEPTLLWSQWHDRWVMSDKAIFQQLTVGIRTRHSSTLMGVAPSLSQLSADIA